MCKTGTQTASTTSAPNPAAMSAYDSLLGTAAGVAATPYTPYSGTLVAPVNEQQYQGVGNINDYAMSAQPAISTAENMATNAAAPLTTEQIQQYQSPYTADVVNATEAQFANQNAQQLQGVKGNAIAQGAMGGNREAIAEAEMTNQQQLAQAPVIAGLENQGYTTGLNTAETEQQAEAAGAYSLGNLGVSGENAALTGANAQVGAGTLEQQTQQAEYSAAYQQFLNQLAYPFQTTQWLAGIDTGVGSQMGGTSSTTQPGPNTTAQDVGLGIAGLAPLLACLWTGGGVTRAEGGGVANRHMTVPESEATMHAQQRQLVHGHRRAQMFPHGTKELSLPHGMHRAESEGGVFHFNPRYLSARDIHHHSSEGTENNLLDLGPFHKSEVLRRVAGGEIPLAVVERDHHGTEVRAAVGTHTTAPHQFEAMHRTKSPGHTIHIEDIRSTLGRRMQGGRVQGLDAGGVAFSGSPYGGSNTGSAPAMPYTGGSSFIPTMGITRGQGAPPPPKMGQQPDYAGDAMKAVAGMNKQIKAGSQQQGPQNIVPSAEAFSPTPVGAMNPGIAPETFSPTDFSGSAGAVYRRGGAVHPLIGVANHSSIRMPQNYYRGGVVQHFDDGGAAVSPPPDFDNEFYSPIQHTDPLREIMSDPAAMSAYANRASANALAAHPGIAPPQSIAETPRSLSIDADSDMPPIIRNGPKGVAPSASNSDPSIMAFASPDSPGGHTFTANYSPRTVPETPREPADSEGVAPKSGVDWSSSGKLWPSLMAMGFGMASSRNPSFAGVVGEGGLRGMSQYSAAQEQDMSQAKIKLEAQKLSQEMELNRQKLAEETRYHNIEGSKPVPMYSRMVFDPATGGTKSVVVYGVRGQDGQMHAIQEPPEAASPRPNIYSPPRPPGAPTSSAAPPPVVAATPPASTSDWPMKSGGAVRQRDVGGPAGPDVVDEALPPAAVPVAAEPVAAPAPRVHVAQNVDPAVASDTPPAIAAPAAAAASAPRPHGDLFGIPGENADLVGDEYLAQFSPSFQSAVKDYISGRTVPISNPRAPAIAWVKRAAEKYGNDIGDPVDDTKYTARRQYRSQLSSASPSSAGGQRNLLTTTLGHLADVAQYAEDVKPSNGGDIPIVGSLIGNGINAIDRYSPEQAGKFNRLNTGVQRYSGEITKLYSGSQGAEGERLHTQGNYGNLSTGYEFAGALEADVNMLRSKVDGMERQRNDVLGSGGKDVHFLTPLDVDNINTIKGAINRLKGVDADARMKQLTDSGMPKEKAQQQLIAEKYQMPGAPPPKPLTISPTGDGPNATRAQLLYDARAAIAQHAPRDAVIKAYVAKGGNAADLQ